VTLSISLTQELLASERLIELHPFHDYKSSYNNYTKSVANPELGNRVRERKGRRWDLKPLPMKIC